MSATRRRKSLGALRYADNELSNTSENELNNKWDSSTNRKSLYSIHDEDEEISTTNNFNDKSRSKSVPRASSPTAELQTKF